MPSLHARPRLFSYPSLVNLTSPDATRAPESWIQVAMCGDYTSTRYGEFSITPRHLVEMEQNFTADRCPVDYDHLTDSPTQPGQAIAAGWIQRLERRDGGRSLWALAQWTPKAAAAIRAKEYRFTSPSFVSAYTTPTGQEVGAKLLACALTNTPFLPEMAAVTLSADPVFGHLATRTPSGARHLSTVQQRVSFHDDPSRTPELTGAERRETYTVVETVGQGQDQFVRLLDSGQNDHGWYRSTQLAPAEAPHKADPAPLTEPDPAQKETDPMTTKLSAEHATAELLKLARPLVSTTVSLSDAIKSIGEQRPDLAEAWHDTVRPDDAEEPVTTPAAMSLSAKQATTLAGLVGVLQAERPTLGARAVISLASQLRPDLVEKYAVGA